jgi:hypothetical protein
LGIPESAKKLWVMFTRKKKNSTSILLQASESACCLFTADGETFRRLSFTDLIKSFGGEIWATVEWEE